MSLFKMIENSVGPLPSLRILFLSSFVPRQCGLATFTEDLMDAITALGANCSVIAMNRPGEHHAYDRRVIATIQEDRLDDYMAVIDTINSGRFDVLCIEHEYGIFGGTECDHLLRLLEAVNIPVITTLHTLLQHPPSAMRNQLYSVAKRSSALVVMNGLGVEILSTVYGIDPAQVFVVHHGAPLPTESIDTATLRQELNCADHHIISTFGLLGPGKGLEYAIQSIPEVAKRHPNARYYILGKTHPVIVEQHGERYREELQSLACQLGVEENVIFVNKYFSKDELLKYLQVSDIYLTPYLDMEQVTSGTLSYAMACGRPIISTPYLHARFLLDEGRGILVTPKDPAAISEACCRLLGDQQYRSNMEQANKLWGQQLRWPKVGQAFLDICRQEQAFSKLPVMSNLFVGRVRRHSSKV